jgi:hypothetical protein
MDKDTVIRIAKEAAEKIPSLFPAWYAKESLPQKKIDQVIEEWWSYVEDQQRNFDAGMLSFPKVRAGAQKFVDQYEAGLENLQRGHEKVNHWSDMPRSFDEYRMFCGLLVCREFVKYLDESNTTKKQQTKHNWIGFFSSVSLELLLEGGEDPTNVIIKALENARHEDFKKPGLSLEDQRSLAEGLLAKCKLYLDERKMKIVSNAVENFFAESSQPIQKNRSNEPETLTPELHFKSKAHLEAVLTTLQKLELIGSENQWLGRKNQIGTLKDVLKNRGYFNDEVSTSDEKLVPLLAQLFKTTISNRATRERPKNDGDLKKDLITILPKLP